MEKINAIIEDVELCKIFDLWKRKPRGLQFNDTDALIITAKTHDGKKIKETFYFCLKPDGGFNVDTISHDGSRARRQKLAAFLKHYNFTDDVKRYNLSEGIKEWRGKKIEIIPYKDSGYIFIPGYCKK